MGEVLQHDDAQDIDLPGSIFAASDTKDTQSCMYVPHNVCQSCKGQHEHKVQMYFY